jgi:hypothetical protein
MSEPSERIQTRATNVHQHPSLVVPKRRRRTQEEIRLDNEREEKEKEAARQAKEKKMRDLASLEDSLKNKDIKANAGRAVRMPMRPKPTQKVSDIFSELATSTYILN